MPEVSLIPTTDNTLLERAGKGDHAAFAAFYDRVSGPFYSMAKRMLADEQEAQDAVVEGMQHLWVKAPTFDPSKSAAFTWAVMLFRSRLIDRVRRQVAQKKLLDAVTAKTTTDFHDEPEAVDSLARQEDCAIVRKALSALKSDQRDLLNEAFFSGKTQAEIADSTGKPLGTVKTVIRRALIELRSLLAREGYER